MNTTMITPRPISRTPLRRPALAAVLVAALLLATASLWWAVAPDRSPFEPHGPDAPPLLIQPLVGAAAAHLLVAGLAVVSTVVSAVALARSGPRRRGARGVLRLPAVAALGLATASVLVLLSPSMLAALGYTLAFLAPVAVVVGAVLVFARYPRARLPLGLAVVILAVAAWVFNGVAVAASVVGTVGVVFLGQSDGLLLLLVAGAVLQAGWILVFVDSAARHPSLVVATRWVTAHRRTLTYLAALGPLPYAVARLTWLTPWPQLGDPGGDLAIRVWGLLLSLGAWAGIVLTLGLISPWGEVFPRWLPGLAGRAVPPLAAIVPGGLVAIVLILEAVPFLQLGLGAPQGPVETALMAVVFPLWFWGPMLGLAVWAYAGHRAGVLQGAGVLAQAPAPGNTYPSS